LASGRGYLVEKLIKSNIPNPIIMTDFSPQILRRNREWYSHFGLYDQVSLVACDARYLPFKDRSVAILTTYLGLPNISEPGTVLAEWQRILAGTLFVISYFYDKNDETNSGAIRKFELETFLFEHNTINAFTDLNWKVNIPSRCKSKALPTPQSELVEGLGIDGLPVAATEIEWCVLSAEN
jgi:ubiquinone/menaquinone biosynthesis C-methylase UbiE